MSEVTDLEKSNEYCMRASGQAIPETPYTMPDEETRRLRAKLIWEEAVETIDGLGFGCLDMPSFDDLFTTLRYPDLEATIDGCCDLNFVSVGTLRACGVPLEPHQAEVNRANEAKFPGGKPVPHPTIPGKFGKPEGWTGPDHYRVARENGGEL